MSTECKYCGFDGSEAIRIIEARNREIFHLKSKIDSLEQKLNESNIRLEAANLTLDSMLKTKL